MNTAVILIRNEIEKRGVISFAHFMALSLYTPGAGYYECSQRIGRSGDYLTSVSPGSLYGELLGFQFAEWLEESGCVHIVEGGAHDGQLALDVLNYLKKYRLDLVGDVQYWLVEPSAIRQKWQEEKLESYIGQVIWHTSWSSVTKNDVRGIIYGNELMDAFPVHRLGWDKQQKQWFEWGVTAAGKGFGWKRMDKPALKSLRNETFQVPHELGQHLPDGFVTVSSPEAANWWYEAACRLGKGRILTIDYGLDAEAFFAPERIDGTLRAFKEHKLICDLLANPGQQDITASVNFTVLRTMGELAGLNSRPMETQENFLTCVFERTLSKPHKFPEWTEGRRRQFKTLIHPEHFGRQFRVLEQSRG